MKILFMKISSQNAWLVDENISVLGINQFMKFVKIHELSNLQNSMNHRSLRPQKFGAIRNQQDQFIFYQY